MSNDEHVSAPVPEEAATDGDPGGPANRRGILDRRRFLQFSGGAAAAGALGGMLLNQGTAAAAPSAVAKQLAPTPGHGSSPLAPTPGVGTATVVNPDLTATPIRPPAVPLLVRQPYVSTWLQATAQPGTWQTFWTGQVTAIAGVARIDGRSYMFMGDPGIALQVPNGNSGQPSVIYGFEAALDQTKLEVTPTRSVFTMQGAGVQMTVEFLSPVEPGDLQRQSIPLGYVFVTVQAIDGKTHDVQVYMDISGEWCSGDRSQGFTWQPSTIHYKNVDLQNWALQLANPQPLTEVNQQAEWGTTVWSTLAQKGLTYQSGPANDVRAQFVDNGVLTDANDTNYTAINNNYPVFAFASDLGSVGSQAQSLQYSVGLARTPAVSYLGKPLQPLWTTYWGSWQDMVGFFHVDAAGAGQRADALDAKINSAASAAGGTAYQGLCAISLRQAYGGTELVVGPDGSPWAFLKEISSDGDTSTVDVMFPAAPVWWYLDPQYMSLLLEPLLAYAESGQWTQPFAEHDLGPYPNAPGYPGGGGENMPVEESGNMIIMAAGYLQASAGGSAKPFLTKHYATLKKWADYLVANLPDPGYQNQTDDFAGFIAHSVNLAVKGIVAVAGMGQIAQALGNTADAQHYQSQAQQFIAFWLSHAQDPSGQHLDLTYNGSDGGNGTWGTTYNAYADSLLGTNLIPKSVRDEQAAWYPQVSNLFGVPLQVPHSYSKTDWEMWLAAWLADYPVKDELIQREYLYANTTPSRVPFSDLYDTISGNQVGFQARPVQGGVFALLALQAFQAKRG